MSEGLGGSRVHRRQLYTYIYSPKEGNPFCSNQAYFDCTVAIESGKGEI